MSAQNRLRGIAAANWDAVQSVSGDKYARVLVSDLTVSAVVALIKGTILANGEAIRTITADDYFSASVYPFGPTFLDEAVRDQLRSLLARDSDRAACLFDEIVARGIQFGAGCSGKSGANITAVNCPADVVNIGMRTYMTT